MATMLYLAWLSTITVSFCFGQYVSPGGGYGNVELGRISSIYNKNVQNRGANVQDHQNRDLQRHDVNYNRNGQWAGRGGERDDAYRRNNQQFRDQAAGQRQDYSNDNSNIGNIVQQIRDEGLKNAYRINENIRYRNNNRDQANGFNAANARKNAYDRGSNLIDNINYKFNKRYDKKSSESGGYADENGRKFSKVDLIDEREKDDAIRRNNNEISRRQNENQQAIKESDWRANANQAQATGGQYGFADKQLEAAGERTDERAIDYNRRQNQFRENEEGVDSAYRLAQDLAEQAAGYRNEAKANAIADRAVLDNKYYGGAETANKGGVGHGDEYGVSGPVGPNAKREDSGGNINSGFRENADQRERAEELARAAARSSANARNEYNRLKDRVVYDEARGLKDTAQGAFRQGVSDKANQGYSANAAEAAKHASESDKNFAGRVSNSDFASRQRALNEDLRDRDYVLRKQNDENETFLRRKNFYHNQNEGGQNDERLIYDRNKNAREFGAAEEAEVARQNQFARGNEQLKEAGQDRSFEDSVSRRAQIQNRQDDFIRRNKGHEERAGQEGARAGSQANAYDRRKGWESTDNSNGEEFQNKQALWDTAAARQAQDQQADYHNKDVQADVETINRNSNGPFGNINSANFVGADALSTGALVKRQKEHNIPNVQIDIQPVPQRVRSQPPKPKAAIPAPPPIHPLKPYHPPKYQKKEVSYNTHLGPASQSRNRGRQEYGNFQRINTNVFNQPTNAFSRLGNGIIGTQRGRATNAFNKSPIGFSRSRNSVGSLVRTPGRFGSFGAIH